MLRCVVLKADLIFRSNKCRLTMSYEDGLWGTAAVACIVCALWVQYCLCFSNEKLFTTVCSRLAIAPSMNVD